MFFLPSQPAPSAAYAKQPNANDAKMLRAYLGYLLGAGQELLPQLGYAPLPSSIDQQAEAQLSKIGLVTPDAKRLRASASRRYPESFCMGDG